MNNGEIERLTTGIEGFDDLTRGGLPKNRLTLLAGTAGSGKTVMAGQFLAHGIQNGDAVVFVTFEERPQAIVENLRSFGWDIQGWVDSGKWSFVDGSPEHDDETVFTGGPFDLTPLLSRVVAAVERSGATRVAIDSIGALLGQFDDSTPARQGLFRLGRALERLGVTTVMTAERVDDYGPIARHGFEEFVADNVVILRNARDGEKRRRSVEVLKLRGGSHLRGEHLFTLIPGQGMVVVPVALADLTGPLSSTRHTSGNAALDEMCGGGLFEKSLVLVSGPTGTGKSLMAAQFVAGAGAGGRALLHSFEESREQLIRNARGWGFDFEAMEQAGTLRIEAAAPESAALEDHLQHIKAVIADYRPERVAIDSLTALERISTVRGFRDYVLALTYHMKHQSVVVLVTTAARDFARGEGTGELHVSTISDAIVLLHYRAKHSEVRRGLNVLKMRGSDHDKTLREFTITSQGMQLGEPFEDIVGLV
jgi:circadian clock protein KaiC